MCWNDIQGRSYTHCVPAEFLNRLRLLIVANNAVFAIPKGAAVREDEDDDDLEEDLRIAAELAEEGQQNGEGKFGMMETQVTTA